MPKIEQIAEDLQLIKIVDTCSSYLLRSDSTYVLIEGGYPKFFPKLLNRFQKLNITVEDISYFIATHVHLDHVGFAGELASRNPELKVLVHELGAKHVLDPSRLNSSAQRTYGENFEVYGGLIPVPSAQLIAIKDGDSLKLPNNELTFHHTPGHAKHHLAIFERNHGYLFTGDALGNRSGKAPLFPVTPPADYDLELVLSSLDKIEKLNPNQLLFTHQGPASPSETIPLIEEARQKHKMWVEAVQDELSKDPNLTNSELVENLKARIPFISANSRFILSFLMNVAGIRLYLKRKKSQPQTSQ